MEIFVKMKVTPADISNAFVSAIESSSGSHYWLRECRLVSADLHLSKSKREVWYGQEALFAQDYAFAVRYDDPKCDNEGDGTGQRTLTQEDVKIGLQVMADKWPRHFADLITEEGDAITADVLMQCIVLGAIVYG